MRKRAQRFCGWILVGGGLLWEFHTPFKQNVESWQLLVFFYIDQPKRIEQPLFREDSANLRQYSDNIFRSCRCAVLGCRRVQTHLFKYQRCVARVVRETPAIGCHRFGKEAAEKEDTVNGEEKGYGKDSSIAGIDVQASSGGTGKEDPMDVTLD